MALHELDSLDVDGEDSDEDNLENTYLTFAVGSEEFALHVTHVIEIVRLQKIFAVPDVPSHIRGVINLRGKVIPLLDVRGRFGVDLLAYTDRTVVVVIELAGSPTGLVVDRVFDVAEILPAQLEPAPTSGHGERAQLVTNMTKRGDRLIFIIDAPTLVNGAPLPANDSITATPGHREGIAP